MEHVQKKQNKIIRTINRYLFLFEELVKRDFKQKYKRTVLGMFWSVLSPLLSLLHNRHVPGSQRVHSDASLSDTLRELWRS